MQPMRDPAEARARPGMGIGVVGAAILGVGTAVIITTAATRVKEVAIGATAIALIGAIVTAATKTPNTARVSTGVAVYAGAIAVITGIATEARMVAMAVGAVALMTLL